MRFKTAAAGVAVTLLVLAGAATGCVRQPLPESMRIDTAPFGESSGSSSGSQKTSVDETFELQGATDAKIDLGMGAGELTVGSSDSSALAEASFDYRTADMRPQTTYDVSGSTGQLTISQPNVRYKLGQASPYSWDVNLGKGIPMELLVQMGAGSSDLNLSELDVRKLTLRLGAGETKVDLTGPRPNSLVGDIQAGVGQLTIVLPKDVGVKVTGRKSGIGSFEADGFKTYGDSFVNDAYGKTPTSIELTVMRGVGDVRLELR